MSNEPETSDGLGPDAAADGAVPAQREMPIREELEGMVFSSQEELLATLAGFGIAESKLFRHEFDVSGGKRMWYYELQSGTHERSCLTTPIGHPDDNRGKFTREAIDWILKRFEGKAA